MLSSVDKSVTQPDMIQHYKTCMFFPVTKTLCTGHEIYNLPTGPLFSSLFQLPILCMHPDIFFYPCSSLCIGHWNGMHNLTAKFVLTELWSHFFFSLTFKEFYGNIKLLGICFQTENLEKNIYCTFSSQYFVTTYYMSESTQHHLWQKCSWTLSQNFSNVFSPTPQRLPLDSGSGGSASLQLYLLKICSSL